MLFRWLLHCTNPASKWLLKWTTRLKLGWKNTIINLWTNSEGKWVTRILTVPRRINEFSLWNTSPVLNNIHSIWEQKKSLKFQALFLFSLQIWDNPKRTIRYKQVWDLFHDKFGSADDLVFGCDIDGIDTFRQMIEIDFERVFPNGGIQRFGEHLSPREITNGKCHCFWCHHGEFYIDKVWARIRVDEIPEDIALFGNGDVQRLGFKLDIIDVQRAS